MNGADNGGADPPVILIKIAISHTIVCATGATKKTTKLRLAAVGHLLGKKMFGPKEGKIRVAQIPAAGKENLEGTFCRRPVVAARTIIRIEFVEIVGSSSVRRVVPVPPSGPFVSCRR